MTATNHNPIILIDEEHFKNIEKEIYTMLRVLKRQIRTEKKANNDDDSLIFNADITSKVLTLKHCDIIVCTKICIHYMKVRFPDAFKKHE